MQYLIVQGGEKMAYKKNAGSRGSGKGGAKKSFTSAQAHQKVGETKFGYKKVRTKSGEFKMKKVK